MLEYETVRILRHYLFLITKFYFIQGWIYYKFLLFKIKNSYQQREKVNQASSLNETQKHHKLASLMNSLENSHKFEAVPRSIYRKVSASNIKYDKSLLKMVPSGVLPPSNTPGFKSTILN